MKKTGIKKKIKWLVPLLIIGFFIWYSFFRQPSITSIVRKVNIENKIVQRTVSTNGSIKSLNQADLSFTSYGKIQKINVKEGDFVKKNQLLSYTDNTTLAQNAQSYKDARDSLIRQRDLYEKDMYKNIKSLGGEDQYNIKLRQYNEQVSQAEAAYQAQIGTLNGSYIYAPFDGTVVEITKDQGETAALGETVIKMADLSNLIFEIQVDQEDYGLLKEGQNVEIKLDAYKGFTYKGSVSKLPYYADTSTDNFVVKISVLSDKEHPLRLGMLGDAYVILQTTSQEVPVLTVDEISYDEQDKPFIWIVQNTKLKKQYIETGLEGDIYTEIKTNISDPIVISANNDVKMQEGNTAKFIN